MRWIAFSAIAVLFVLCAMAPGGVLAASVNVSILYTGDTHGHLESFYYESSKPVGGVAKRAIFFQEKRRHKGMIWLTLDAGDAISGTPISDVFKGYLDIAAMNLLKYDAMVLGVHEFDYGPVVLKQRMSEANFPILSANIIDAATNQPFATPYVILEREGTKIAILGLTSAELANKAAPENFAGLRVNDPIATAHQLLPQLAAQADLIVALTHLGIDEDIKLASQVPGIDIIVGGMSHSELEVPMKVGQTLIVHDGFYGRSVGLLKLSFTSQGPGAKYERVYFDSMLEPMAGKWVENTNYLSWLGAYKTQMAERMGMIIGTAASTMSNVKTKSSETEIGNYVCDILRESTGADVALLPAAFFRGVLPEGPLTLGDLFTALPYDHYAVVLNVTGGELQEILGDAAKQIGRPGFPQVSGVSFGIVRGKAWQVRVAGQEIDPFASYRLVTTDALADGAHGYATMGTVSDRRYTGRLVRDLVRERLAAGQVASSTLYSRIAFLAQEPVYATPPPPAATSPPPVATPPPLPGEPPASADIPGPGEDEPASLDEPPAPANGGESEMDITRYDRTGQPLVVIEEEIVTDPASQIEDTPQPPPPPASTPDDAPAGETPSPPSQPDQGTAGAPADDPASDALGRARDNQNGLDYDFSLARTPEGYEYRLSITNNTGAASTLDYATGERFDFIIYSGSDMVWNYNYNRFFSQAQSAEPLAPGEVITFSGKWNGMGMDSELLSGQNYHFEAVHQLMDNPVRLAFDAPL